MWKSREDGIKRAEIFADTLKQISEIKTLSDAVSYSISNSLFYSPVDYPEMSEPADKAGLISISGERSFECAVRLKNENPNNNICVLNMASSVHPGGGVSNPGYVPSAQEEALCLASTLYPVLNCRKNQELYYLPNKKESDNFHNDALIYTPGVVICKTDTKFPERIAESEYRTVSVVSCAAPNLNTSYTKKWSGDNPFKTQITDDELYNLIYKRFSHVLHCCAANGVDILVAGAWGCGAFKCPAEIVSKAMVDASVKYRHYFSQIVFAIKRSPKRTNRNYEAFAEEISSAAD